MKLLVVCFILALAACACSAQSYNAELQYTFVPKPASRNLLKETFELRSALFALSQNDFMINDRLISLESRINASSDFRRFFRQTLSGLIAGVMQGQDDRIRAIRDQLNAQRNLVSDVEALRLKVDSLISQLIQLRATRRNVLNDIQALQDADDVGDQQICNLEAEAEQQDARLWHANFEVAINEAKADEVKSNLQKIVNVTNLEAAIVFDVELPFLESPFSFTFDPPRSVDPGFTWGIVAYKIFRIPSVSNPHAFAGYGPPPRVPEEAIRTRVQVEVDRNGGGARMVDTSEGWSLRSVRIRLSVFVLDNDPIEYTLGQFPDAKKRKSP